ncbi:protein BANP-like isoform X2 [Neopsephotus bourkii]|uniref:protein BANP-like isoform X2 n=1 Tax=Neopsephotus bourkii TaxID=309878 RepID=UPI002AA52CE5|nr:protein BANP-like isoform X2 [Neopsephotus bourkii]
MMSEQDLADVVQIAVEDLTPDNPVVLENPEVTDDIEPALKHQHIEINCQDPSIKSFLYSINQGICLRLNSIEAKLLALEAACKSLEEKFDLVMNKQHSPIQVPMVGGVPLGATQTSNKVRCAVPGRRQNTIVVKVPGYEDSHNGDGESGSEASDSVSKSGQIGSHSIGNNVTLITLNSEEDYPNGTWLGDENNPEMRVRCLITPADMLHISTNCRTAEKMALTLLDYLFHREIQAISNLSGQGKHGKKQLDPLMIYGIRCHLFYKFGITESDWYRIKQSIDSKCRTAWRRKQRGQSLAVKSFSRRTPSSSYSGSEGSQSSVSASNEIQQNQPQTLHYTLANAQQVQIHQIGEDGQVQVGHLHIAQVPQGEQVQITQDSEGNLQIHQVHVGQDGQVGTELSFKHYFTLVFKISVAVGMISHY